jgi:hypothetical protein
MLNYVRKHKVFNDVNKKYRIKKWKRIGSGAYGVAYDIGKNLACKITTNKREARIAEALKSHNRKTSFLYKVLDIFYVKAEEQEDGLFALIITPKYKKLTKKEKRELWLLLDALWLKTNFTFKSYEQIKNMVARNLNDYDWKTINKVMSYIKKYDIIPMLKNLKAIKLKRHDIHEDNILKNGKRYVLIDIGW